MVQLRLMHDDPEKVREVAARLLPLMRESGLFFVGDETELPNRRGPGLRIVVEATVSPDGLRIWVEQQDEQPHPATPAAPVSSPSARPVRSGRGRRALPPGGPRS